MHVIVVPTPSRLPQDSLSGRTVVVLDVLRATTTVACALAAGATEVRAYPSLGRARSAFEAFIGAKVLAGERECIKPPGFDLGNSPLDMTRKTVAGKTLFLSTTNGTRAISAAYAHPNLLGAGAPERPPCFAAALVNARATARQLGHEGRDILLLCAGSDGETAEEDLIGAGAVLDALGAEGCIYDCAEDEGAVDLFNDFRRRPLTILKATRGGRKLLGAGLASDIAACAELDRVHVVCRVDALQHIKRLEMEPV